MSFTDQQVQELAQYHGMLKFRAMENIAAGRQPSPELQREIIGLENMVKGPDFSLEQESFAQIMSADAQSAHAAAAQEAQSQKRQSDFHTDTSRRISEMTNQMNPEGGGLDLDQWTAARNTGKFTIKGTAPRAAEVDSAMDFAAERAGISSENMTQFLDQAVDLKEKGNIAAATNLTRKLQLADNAVSTWEEAGIQHTLNQRLDKGDHQEGNHLDREYDLDDSDIRKLDVIEATTSFGESPFSDSISRETMESEDTRGDIGRAWASVDAAPDTDY